MEKKFVVEICAGTKCYVLGGAQLINLEESLPSDLKEQVKIEQVRCLAACNGEESQPPYVKINGHLMPNATIAHIIEFLRAN